VSSIFLSDCGDPPRFDVNARATGKRRERILPAIGSVRGRNRRKCKRSR